jgi:hypothetical protein
VRAVVAAGVDVREVMVDANGAIRVIVGKPTSVADVINEWDAVYEPTST